MLKPQFCFCSDIYISGAYERRSSEYIYACTEQYSDVMHHVTKYCNVIGPYYTVQQNIAVEVDLAFEATTVHVELKI